MPPLSVLLLGDLTRPEFQGIREFLESFGPVHHFRESDLDRAVNALAAGEIAADMTVVAQSYPGEFSEETIDRLRAASPLSRIIALLGSWCEGEMRSGQPWPGVIRLYWHQGVARIGREISRLIKGDLPSWGLPLTATEEERLLAAIPSCGADCRFSQGQRQVGNLPHDKAQVGNLPHDDTKGLIGIATRRLESFEWLSAACRHRGYATLWLREPHYPRVEGFLAVLLEGTDFRGAEFETFEVIAARYPQARRIAIMDFPRTEDCRRLIAAGAAAVISKPFNVEELFEEIRADRLPS